jgi:hypothetical protein
MFMSNRQTFIIDIALSHYFFWCFVKFPWKSKLKIYTITKNNWYVGLTFTGWIGKTVNVTKNKATLIYHVIALLMRPYDKRPY